jgi:ABC-2 type transport system ATP-binding protein
LTAPETRAPAKEGAPRLSVKNLHKRYGPLHALKNLSFSAGAGEIVGLLGPNGAGKTTAIHILLGVLKPTEGEVSVLGLSPFRTPEAIYPRINFSSAYTQLPFNLKARKNLLLFARLYGVPRPEERVEELLREFDVEDLADKMTGSLSSGEQTRLNLCKSLLNDPEILFLDEPTASLDPDIADRVQSALKEFQRRRGLTIIYTSHNMAEVESLCDRVLFIHRGQKVIEGTPDQVRRHFQKESLEKVFIHLARGGEVVEVET